MLAFDGETLNEAIAQVSQQTGWRFELEDPAIGALRVRCYVQTSGSLMPGPKTQRRCITFEPLNSPITCTPS